MGNLSKFLFEKYASSYAKEQAEKYGVKRLDYRGLAELVGDMIMCNNIPQVDETIWDNVHCGSLYYISDDAEDDYAEYLADYENSCDDEEPKTYQEWLEDNREDYEREVDIYQYYLIRDPYWLEKAGELVLYSDKLDCYVWCIDHWGTGWDYVLSNLCVDEGKE
jgi:hypothetical protein